MRVPALSRTLLSATALTSAILQAESAVIIKEVHEVVTAAPKYVTVTAGQPVQVTKDQTVSELTTLFIATTTPVTVIQSTIITSISLVSVPPVTQYSTYSTTSLSKTIDPATYTTGLSIPPNTVATAGPTSSNQATPVAAPSAAEFLLSTPASSTSIPSTLQASFTSSSPSSSTPSSGAPVLSSSTVGSVASLSSLVSLPASSSSTSSSSSSAAGISSSESAAPVSQPSSGAYYQLGGDIFSQPVSTEAPASVFPREDLDISIPSGVNNNGNPLHTNKFYSNLFLADQMYPVYAQPYSVWWSNDTNYYGMAISHVNHSQRAFGPDPNADPVEYYINPIGLMSFVYSASEFTNDNMQLSVSDSDTFSVNAALSTGGSSGSVNFPLVVGMGFVTAEYNGLTPYFYSQLGFNSVTKSSNPPASNIQKYIITLFNGVTWNLYATVPEGQDFDLDVLNDFEIKATTGPANGVVIQVGVVPAGADSSFDKAAGQYPVSASVSASVNNDVASYTIDYSTKGTSAGGTTWIWTLPHQTQSFDSSMSSAATQFTIDSNTKGVMTGYLTNKLVMNEVLNTGMQFLPWSSQSSFSGPSYSQEALQLMASVANQELAQDISGQTNSPSTYTSGKAFDKFAYILLVVKDILKNDDLAKSGLANLQQAFSLFTSNTQQTPLIYDTLLKGVTSSAAQNGGSPLDDYGSPYYNDHHFHYGYMVHAAAIIGYIDQAYGGNWINENKDWVNSLVRDVANPSHDDSYFPVSRMFDWFSGHSWAHGMFASADGKDEESSSEDYNFAYGMKLWGKVTGDANMEARGDLMLSVMARSLSNYFLMLDNNTNQPSNFIKNKVPGITFENKVDHTTYFGTNLEYIQGIHMIPITPASGLIRSAEFVEQEWTEKLASIIDSLDSGWAGILRSNQALYDPVSAYNYFAQDNFQPQWLDGGASRTWYLALSAGLGGSPSS
ncbi:Dse4p [Sugiyamaella lignohabitans]|uniref:glucan endo-1,3-beta-D-glucosidase n=1 Tax=Sugiyamaella lignohabitans TaxID=796027 RepID=A0A167FD97_9ASCO|nr:Dse4p [Sugiyamaella lignohabitans]ANB15149.1 Dse4p [Sugiyamaella lignohabitans]